MPAGGKKRKGGGSSGMRVPIQVHMHAPALKVADAFDAGAPPLVMPHTAIHVPSYCYICLILLYMCPHTAIYVLYMCPHAIDAGATPVVMPEAGPFRYI